MVDWPSFNSFVQLMAIPIQNKYNRYFWSQWRGYADQSTRQGGCLDKLHSYGGWIIHNKNVNGFNKSTSAFASWNVVEMFLGCWSIQPTKTDRIHRCIGTNLVLDHIVCALHHSLMRQTWAIIVCIDGGKCTPCSWLAPSPQLQKLQNPV